MTKKGSNDKEKKKKGEKITEKKEKEETPIVSEELIRWMTEGTSPHLSPRSDCG
jgi:ribosomal protein S25